MYSQPETILDQYELTVNEITKGRGTYICDTNQGMKILTPFRGSKERAEFLEKILQYLYENGFIVEQISRTKDGEVLALDETETGYLLKDMFAGSECSTKSPEEMYAAVQMLAKLHMYFETCPIEIPEFIGGEENQLLVLYEKHYRELIKVKNYVKARKRKNEFEMKFQHEYPYYMEQAGRSVDMLSECAKVSGGCKLCHGDFNQHNVIHTKNGWQIINFEFMNSNLLMSDLANFLRKMMEKNNWNLGLGLNLIQEYACCRQISKEEYKQLYILLLFPEKFWKISNHYYNTHKAWLSGRNIEKLDRMREQEEARTRFLENLFSIVE